MFLWGLLLFILTSSEAVFDNLTESWNSNEYSLKNGEDAVVKSILFENQTDVSGNSISIENLSSQTINEPKLSDNDEMNNMYNELEKTSESNYEIEETTSAPELTESNEDYLMWEESDEDNKSDDPGKVTNDDNEDMKNSVYKQMSDTVSNTDFPVSVDDRLKMIKELLKSIPPALNDLSNTRDLLSVIVGRPPTRWTDDLVKVAGSRWMRAAQNRSLWRFLGEAFVQQWTSFG